MTDRTWKPGELIVERHVFRDMVRWAAPMWCAHDDGRVIASYLPIETIVQTMGDAEGNRTREYHRAVQPVTYRWQDHHALHLTREGDNYNVTLFWTEDWKFRCWYVNFQEPMRRYAHGFETMDQTLDLVIAPDRERWIWKDEHEFQWGIDAGWYTASQMDELKAIGLRVLDGAKAGAWPFADGWEHWRPDPSWGIPVFPEGWDRLES